MKAWLGFGISNFYLKFSKDIKNKIEYLPFEEYVFLIADGMQKKYNGKFNTKINEQIFKNLISISFSRTISSEELKDYIPLKEIKDTYNKNRNFYLEVNDLVIKNRLNCNQKNIEMLAGYVIEELAQIVYFHNKGFMKIGCKEKELYFDNLAQKYFNIPKKVFKYI